MTIGSLIAALALIGGVAATLDVPVPKPAWENDVRQVQAQVQDVDRLATQEALENVQLRLYRNLSEQDDWKSKGKRVPDYLLKEQTALELKKQRLERRLLALQ